MIAFGFVKVGYSNKYMTVFSSQIGLIVQLIVTLYCRYIVLTYRYTIGKESNNVSERL